MRLYSHGLHRCDATSSGLSRLSISTGMAKEKARGQLPTRLSDVRLPIMHELAFLLIGFEEKSYRTTLAVYGYYYVFIGLSLLFCSFP